ncbi:type I-C CRISPR-associated protein Cas5c [Methanomassiliicoccus luminyensis]|uniref:type I-C CRISPR-associated protein Cas5c n=1 Tax=Methanomassiliicoccus luminyensis TaxID=1080712 RepID=UPI00191D2326|nr:type I-C CRISPR-associated protein Cas5c [Methanomassiliicoccus luminyensis]
MVWGDYACFTRPEMKVERVSYDVMTPSAARGVLEAIYWKPAIRWNVDKIHVMNPIKFDNIRRNERSGKISSVKVERAMREGNVSLYQDKSEDTVQRASLLLRDVCYCIDAHFDISETNGETETDEKHYNMALRRMRKGQCFHHPYLGCREFSAQFELIEGELPASYYNGRVDGTRDLGIMLWDIDFSNDNKPIFFRAQMKDGIIDVQKCREEGTFS